jgi:hypothetical protein
MPLSLDNTTFPEKAGPCAMPRSISPFDVLTATGNEIVGAQAASAAAVSDAQISLKFITIFSSPSLRQMARTRCGRAAQALLSRAPR